MGKSKLWYLIAYDIREPTRLRKAAKLLEGYGERIQYSLFRARLGEREMERMRWELQKILDKDDSLIIIGLCSSCITRLRIKSGDLKWVNEPERFEII